MPPDPPDADRDHAVDRDRDRDRARDAERDRDPDPDAPPTGTLILLIGRARRSLSVEHVRGVLPLGNLTPVPTAPPRVLGLTQVRGQVMPVIDLAPEPAAPQLGDTVVLLEIDGHKLALVVEGVLEVGAPEPAAVDESDPEAVPLDVAAALRDLAPIA